MPYQPFTRSEVERIFRLSEGTAGAGGSVGHAGARHVSITNAGLAERQRDHDQPGLALYTSFVSFGDQVNAALGVLNLPANDALLENFRVNIRSGQRFEIRNSQLTVATRMRYAMPGGARTFPCTYFTLFLRKDPTRPRGMHVVSFFGTMGPVS